jgi:thioesterase domain-containing protein
MEIEQRLGRQISMTALMEAPTVAELATVLESSPSTRSAAALIAVQPRGSARPLFCIHDLESDPFLFAQLARHLGDDQPVYALRYHGSERLDQTPRSFHELARRYVHDLRTVQAHGPYRIAGFCYGGAVAMAVAELLQASGDEVELLTLFNVTPHDLFALVSPEAQERFRSDWLGRVRYVTAKPYAPSWIWRKLTRRIADIGWRLALPWADRLTPGDEKPSAEHLRAVLLAAFDAFEPTAFAGHTLLFAAGETLPLYADDPAAAWAGLTTGRLDVCVAPRDGYSMLVEPDVQGVAQRLARSLEGLRD